ncbi:hypothetical protein SAMN02982929_05511 [Saccharopolyspora kobensis]|uniref:SaeA first Fn3-like domain-containing protein n=1 Tax=Saccharopolyspora kobensis TaxID=146035 RepID=A0A1H6E3P5_9PSEU|nr:hypothetical protein [Saccharopolyspora kobensis]SEG92252.1 hypothetical protein SAMN02982929_05511 [Saccharopolyspora kobensis]SFD36172.1 hypothetical protein SAMN05216506_10440 [Saccharopolyspora kobensis]
MQPFDPKAYERDVVRPLRGRSGRLPDDLLTRYAIGPDFSDADVAQRLSQVRSHWNKSAQSTAKSSFTTSVYKAFLREDEELRREHGDKMSRMSWWRARHDDRAAAGQAQIDELAQMLKANFGELGLITPGQLEAMREAFGQLAPSEVDKALAKAGVRTAVPLDLPKTSGMPDTLFRRLKELLKDAEVTGIPELLHGKLTSFALLTEFRSAPAQPDGLSAKAVQAAVDRENRRSGNRAAREALGLINSAADLRLLALYHLLDDVRRLRENGAPAGALLRVLRQSGLEEGEARQAVVSVLSEAGPTKIEISGLAKVTELLAAGYLVAAQQALVGIADAEEAATARAAVDRHAEQVRSLREAAHRALERGAEGEARRQLTEASRLAADDDAIAAEVRRIPVSPVADLTAQPEGLVVRLSWRAQPDHGVSTRYRVVRRSGRTPGDATDGDVVAEGAETAVVDTAAAAGAAAGYAVFAAEPDGAWSRPAAVSVEVLPPVHAVQISVRTGAVEGSWKLHRDAIGVDVVRRDDSGEVPISTSGRNAFRDSTVDYKVDCTYLLTARYRRADGTEVRAESVAVRHRARVVPTLPPVTSLEGRHFGRELVVSWVWPDGVRMAEVSWNSASDGGSRRLTRQQYQDEGGCRIEGGPGETRVRVVSIATSDDGENRSDPGELSISGPPAQVGYQVERRNRLFGPSSARIVLTSDLPVPECEVLVVVAPGRVMPLRPEDGNVVHRAVHRIDDPVEITVELPKRKPFWLRCFVSTPGIDLVDPPVTQLKVT